MSVWKENDCFSIVFFKKQLLEAEKNTFANVYTKINLTIVEQIKYNSPIIF